MNEDLEHTRALNDLSDLIKKEEEKPINDSIGELSENTQIFNEETSEELYNSLITEETPKVDESDFNNKDNKKKKGFKEIWHNLGRKKQIIIICSIIVILLLIILTVIIILNKKNDNISAKDEVIVVKDNYIYNDGTLQMIDENNNPVGTYECHNKDANLCYVAYLNNDEDQFEIPINQYEDGSLIKERSAIYLNKYVFIVDQSSNTSNIIYLYDMEKNEILGEYLGIKSYAIDKNNYIILKNKENNYGLIELTNTGINNIIDFKYEYMGLIDKEKDDLIVAKTSKGSYLIDYTDKSKTKLLNGDIIDYNDENVIVKNNNKYSIYDYSGQEYLANYDYIRFIDSAHFAVVSDNNLYIKDLGGSKYNESGYALNNNNYRVINVYGTDNKKINSKMSFTTELNNNILTLNIFADSSSDTYLINLFDGEASTKYNLYSYFDGKLYFYEDEAKTKLIGTYTCSNKNEANDDKLFNNCYIAMDTVLNDTYINPYADRSSTIPMFNNRYVFIYDTPSLVNANNIEIKLYDLLQSKVLGTYSEIDSETLNNNGTFTSVSTKETNIMAKLKSSGYYGVIAISSKGCDVKYKFNYKHIEKYGNYYLAQLQNNNYIIITSENSTSYEFPGKIMSNNQKYFVIKNSDGVMIYKNDNSPTPLINKNYAYIELFDNMFATVDSNNNLWIFKYNDTSYDTKTYSIDKTINNQGRND